MNGLRRIPSRLVFALLALAAPLLASGCQNAAERTTQRPPSDVLVSLPVEREILDYEHLPGRTEAQFTVQVTARVSGYLDKFCFKDGSDVKKDDVLFVIDRRPYKAALDRALATLEQARAREKRSAADYLRVSTLYQRGAVSREEFDLISDNYAEAKASVGIAQANYDEALLNYEWTEVRAPISGRISRRMKDPGNLVKADSDVLTTIITLDPLYIYFDVDERTLLRIRRLIREGKVAARSGTEKVVVEAALADEDDYPHKGEIDFSDNQINRTTGTLQVRGVIRNPEPYLLSPGLFVRVRLPVGKPHRALMVAAQAVGVDQDKKYLYVVAKDTKGQDIAEYRQVKVGSTKDGLQVIESGLKPGELVIVSGLQRVRPNQPIKPKPAPGSATATATASPPRPQAESLARSSESPRSSSGS
jgi:multidrug efflux system membrane fusion protein